MEGRKQRKKRKEKTKKERKERKERKESKEINERNERKERKEKRKKGEKKGVLRVCTVTQGLFPMTVRVSFIQYITGSRKHKTFLSRVIWVCPDSDLKPVSL